MIIKKTWLLSVAFLLSNQVYAYPVPGSYISNIASGDYQDEMGNVLVVNSNPVSLEVQKIYALTLVQNQKQQATIGGFVNFPHVLTNTGNTQDRYILDLEQKTGDDFNFDTVQVYADRDQNGIPDDNINLVSSDVNSATQSITIDLKPGESLAVIVVGKVPVSVDTNQHGIVELIAISRENSSLQASVEDTAYIVDDAVVTLLKSQDLSEGLVGDVITYALTYRNNGTHAAKLIITDVLDESLEYIQGSAVWNQNSTKLTDSDDSEDVSNAGIRYQRLSDEKTLQAEIASVEPLSSGVLSFQAKVKNASKSKIPNTANYNYSGKHPETNYSLNSNTVHYTLKPVLGVVLNNKSTSAVNDGNPNQAPDNLLTITKLKPGQEVFFQNYVWNTGNTTDTYNLSSIQTNVPACVQVRFYSQDGKTLLTDTNGDGVIDTGAVAPSAVKTIQMGVSASTACNTTVNNMTIDVTATSVSSSDITDPTRNVVSQLIASLSESDLYNSDNSGQEVGKVDNSGNAWLSKSVVSGRVIFPLIAENKSTQKNNYNLYASFAEIDPQNIAVVAEAGFSVKFYEGDATCTSLSKQITNTGLIDAGKTKAYCAVIEVDPSQQNFVKPIWFAIHSPINQQADAIKNELSSSVIRELVLSNDQQGQISVGGTIVYIHTLKNTGTLTEGAASGSKITFKVSPLKPDDNFIYSLYYDVNRDGKIDANDKFIDANTDLNQLTNGLGLAKDKDIQLLLKVQAPAAATEGVVSPVDLIVVAGTFEGIELSDLKNTDLTTISSTAMQLIKKQIKAPSCTMEFNAAKVISLEFTMQSISVKPNECVIYQLEIQNKGTSMVTDVQFRDVVPAYTSLVGTPFLIPVGVNNSVGDNIQGTIDSLEPTKTANMYFMIRLHAQQ